MKTEPGQTFHHHGFFEGLLDLDTGKGIGTRSCAEQPGRKFSYHGQKEEIWTSDQVVQRGHKSKVIKASPERPVRVQTTYLPICGRMINEIHSS